MNSETIADIVREIRSGQNGNVRCYSAKQMLVLADRIEVAAKAWTPTPSQLTEIARIAAERDDLKATLRGEDERISVVDLATDERLELLKEHTEEI